MSAAAAAPISTDTPETQVSVITDEQVAQRAYEIYQREGEDQHGNHERHWYQAIEELTSEIGQAVARYFKS